MLWWNLGADNKMNSNCTEHLAGVRRVRTETVIVQGRKSVIKKVAENVPDVRIKTTITDVEKKQNTQRPEIFKRKLNQTLKNKTDETKRYKCPHCFLPVGKPSALVVHLRSHTGERPFTCKECSKSFSTSGNLYRHLMIHTGEKPHKCNKCGKAFNNASHLTRHFRKKHENSCIDSKRKA